MAGCMCSGRDPGCSSGCGPDTRATRDSAPEAPGDLADRGFPAAGRGTAATRARVLLGMHALRASWVVYERRTETRQGYRSVVYERGSQLVWQDRYDMDAPIDDEDPFVGEFSFQREDTDGVDEDGVRYGIERLVKRPRRRRHEAGQGAAPHADGCVQCGDAEAVAEPAAAGRVESATTTVRVMLRDVATGEAIPSLGSCVAAEQLGVGQALRLLRDQRVARRAVARRMAADEVTREVERLGGRVTRVRTGHSLSLEAELSSTAAEALARQPGVVGLRPARRRAARVDSLPSTYLCSGLPVGMRRDVDSDPCFGAWMTGGGAPVLMLGGRAAAAGAYAYLEQGYTGAGGYGLGRSAEGGLSPWAVMWDVASEGGDVDLLAAVPHVTIGVVDGTGVHLDHPAFLSVVGEPRIKYYIDSTGLFRKAAAWSDSQSPPSDPHGTNCAGIALGSVMDGQDSRLGAEIERELRSGLARRAMGVAVNSSGPIGFIEFLDVMHDGGELAEALPSGLGVDVLSYSVNENEGRAHAIGAGGDRDACPTNEQSRGLDDTSLAITHAYREESVVVVKSAGNTHGVYRRFNASNACNVAGSVASEVSAPGAAPAAIPVGAASVFPSSTFPEDTPAGVQQSYDLYAFSARGRTGDGRAYPLLLAQGWGCGNPATSPSGADYYGNSGATSAAAPGVAGGIALFKHWYLDQHGPACANSPGRLISNALNMADGRVFSGSTPNTSRADPPAEGWGFGLYRMRLFEEAYMGPSWHRGTTAIAVEGGFGYEFIPVGRGEHSRVPSNVARLRITAWWLEVNTGAGESKAEIALSLYDAGESGARRLAYKRADGEHVIRLQWDCFGGNGTRAPSGSVYLLANCWGSMPADERYPHRDYRTVYVSWFWETGPDPSLIDCGSLPADTCPPLATGPTGAEDLAASVPDEREYDYDWLAMQAELERNPFAKEEIEIDEDAFSPGRPR